MTHVRGRRLSAFLDHLFVIGIGLLDVLLPLPDGSAVSARTMPVYNCILNCDVAPKRVKHLAPGFKYTGTGEVGRIDRRDKQVSTERFLIGRTQVVRTSVTTSCKQASYEEIPWLVMVTMRFY